MEAFGCRRQTVEKLRERLVTEGFDAVLHGNRPKTLRAKVLDGAGKAKLVAMRLGPPPKGYSNWSLRLLADLLRAASGKEVEPILLVRKD